MKKLIVNILLAALLMGLLAVLACEGDQGPEGPQGPAGEDGPDATIGPPADRVFALAIFNGTELDHNGANTISLTYDSTATPSSSVVVANKLARPPVIDGLDGGSDEWGEKSSTIELEHQAYADNFIYQATVKAAYDDYNVYFLVRWSEVAQGGFMVSKNENHLNWTYDTEDELFHINRTYEDRVALMFQESRTFINDWRALGCLLGCHLGAERMASPAPSIINDTWQWGSVRTNPLEIGYDRGLTSFGFEDDDGIPPIYQNLFVRQRIVDDSTFFDSLPIYMHRLHKNDPGFEASVPMWDYFVTPYMGTIEWPASAELPGWIAQIPSEGNDVMKAKGVYSGGTWTVEFSRPRITNDPFDSDF